MLCDAQPDRKSTRLNSSHDQISYAVFCLKKKWLKNMTRCPANRHSRNRRHGPAAGCRHRAQRALQSWGLGGAQNVSLVLCFFFFNDRGPPEHPPLPPPPSSPI